ncbi:MAG: YggT family protein [Spirochaetia bacterium]|nr:YggT family protein [Spirochaetia bacterium]
MMKLLEILGFVFSLYTMLLLVRIALVFITPGKENDRNSLLVKMCDPYINFFRKFKISRLGAVDIAPLLAVIVLTIINQVLGRICAEHDLTFGIASSIIISSVWNVIQSFFFIVLIIAAIRYLMLMFLSNKMNAFTGGCDAFFVPLSSKFASLFLKKSASSYQMNLIIFIIFITVVLVAGNFAMKYLTGLLMAL